MVTYVLKAPSSATTVRVMATYGGSGTHAGSTSPVKKVSVTK